MVLQAVKPKYEVQKHHFGKLQEGSYQCSFNSLWFYFCDVLRRKGISSTGVESLGKRATCYLLGSLFSDMQKDAVESFRTDLNYLHLNVNCAQRWRSSSGLSETSAVEISSH